MAWEGDGSARGGGRRKRGGGRMKRGRRGREEKVSVTGTRLVVEGPGVGGLVVVAVRTH